VAALLEKARRLIDEGRPSEAIEVFRSAPPRTPPCASSWPSRATTRTTPARDRGADRRPPFAARGFDGAAGGRSRCWASRTTWPAISATRFPSWSRRARSLRRTPTSPTILGMAYIQNRQPDRARETWARAFHVPADSAAGHLVAAQMMVRAEMEEMAQAELTAALKKDPRLPQANLLLGQAALFRGRSTRRSPSSRRSSRRAPRARWPTTGWADAYTRQLQWDKALDAAATFGMAPTRISAVLHPDGQGLPGQGRPRRRPKACSGAPSATTRTTRPRTTFLGAGPAAARPRGKTRRRSSRSRSGSRPRPTVRRAAAAGRRRCPRPGVPPGRGLGGGAAAAAPDASAWPSRSWTSRASAGTQCALRLRRGRPEALHHRDQRAGVALLDYDKRRLARRAGARRHAAGRPGAHGQGLGAGPGAHEPPLPQPAARKFEDVTERAGLRRTAWSSSVCVGGLRQRRMARSLSDRLPARTSCTTTGRAASRT